MAQKKTIAELGLEQARRLRELYNGTGYISVTSGYREAEQMDYAIRDKERGIVALTNRGKRAIDKANLEEKESLRSTGK